VGARIFFHFEAAATMVCAARLWGPFLRGSLHKTWTLVTYRISCAQGDVRFAEVMRLMGAKVEYEPNAITITGPPGRLKAIDHNCNDIPDAAMTAAVAALFADGCALSPRTDISSYLCVP
jgi:5-enolpyruvylshikimate-3-phosphate synthase